MIVLASKSPRRKELLKNITSDFITYDSKIDESLSFSKNNPRDIVRDIAKRKALKARSIYPNELIIAADTIVLFDNEIIGKPKDKEDAKRILKHLSNNTHLVITSYTIIFKEKIIQNEVESRVVFNDLSDDLITRYVNSSSPLDKAGAYGIQDNGTYPIVRSYFGSYENIIGFPIREIEIDLLKNKSDLKIAYN